MSLKTMFANDGKIDRRTVLRGGLAGLGAAYVLPWSGSTAFAHGSRMFTLGVASGDPGARSVVIWTRLAPEPLTPDGGMAPHPVPVRWEVARDPRMRHVVRRGHGDGARRTPRTPCTSPSTGSIPTAGTSTASSRAARTARSAAPARSRAHHDACSRMRFGLVSCQDFQNGFYSAYANLAAEDLDFIVHVGDYIYEDGARAGAPRQVVGGETMTLADYRVRHAEHKLDPALQAAHAAFPFIATFDDHEVEDNYAGAISVDAVDPALFLQRRARRLSGVLRAPAAARRAAAERQRHAAVPPPALRPAGDVPRARHAAVPHRSAVRRRVQAGVRRRRCHRPPR